MLNRNSYWEDKNVFITGCTGLIGSWLTMELVNRGANVVGLIRDLVPRSNLNWAGFNTQVNIVRGELEDFPLLERSLNEYEIDTVFHLGAQTIVSVANRSPLSTFESNIKGTWNLLEACRRVPAVSRIVVASSDKAYGEQKVLPSNEECPLQATHPYDVSKSCVDLISRSYYETYHLPVCVTRCGNLYGGGDLNFNRIIPGTIKSVMNNKPPIIRSDGTYIRDYFYVMDGVEAYLFLAEQMDTLNIHGEAFNFSNETPQSVMELTETILELMDRKDLQPRVLNQVDNEIKQLYLSARKARTILGWRSKYSLEQGLKETIAWYGKFFSRYKKENKLQENRDGSLSMASSDFVRWPGKPH